jgi:hypothetical protein
MIVNPGHPRSVGQHQPWRSSQCWNQVSRAVLLEWKIFEWLARRGGHGSDPGKPLLDYAYAATGLGNLIDGGTVEQLGSLGVPGITTAYNTTIDSIPHDTIRHSLFLVYGGFNDFSIGELTTATADRAVANLVRLTGHLECVSVPSRLILVC